MTAAKPLDELLDTLRRERDSLDAGDGDARQRLDELIADLETRAGKGGGAAAGAVDAAPSDALKASILKFEASHPRLAGVINDVVDKLSAMGI